MTDWGPFTLIALLGFAITCGILDLAWGRIPNGLTLSAIPLGLCLQFLALGRHGLLSSSSAVLLALGVGWIHFRAGLMGGGDAKMLAGVGALAGVHGLIVCSLWAVCLAGGMGFIRLGTRRQVSAGLRGICFSSCAHRSRPAFGTRFGAFVAAAVVLWVLKMGPGGLS